MLKYRALGDIAVFINFGTLGTLGAWITQTGKQAIIPVTWSIPISMLIVAILHANNWRDIGTDSSRIKTVASFLVNRGSYFYYITLIFGILCNIALIIDLSMKKLV